jgi:pimeloyl-ACP methyl ester carboxylesterase
MIGAIFSDLLTLLGIFLLAVLFIALLAPLESLGWYAGWRQRRAYTRQGPPGASGAAGQDAAQAVPEASHYIVFLSGIGDPSGQWHYPEETEFLRRLREALPQAAVISDLFAYSVTSADIRSSSRRSLIERMWEGIERRVRKNQYAPVGALINLRNLFQVTVSVDHRYGPFFNLGQAENVRDALLAYGYRPGSGKGVYLIGYSGGGQVSLGLASFLNRMLGSPVTVISVGGVMSSETSCLQIEHLYHLWGTKDQIQTMGDIAFVGRWPISKKSAWNEALRRGKITRLPMGPVAHNGSGGYFGPQPLPDGRPTIDQTLEVILSIITTGAPPPSAPSPPSAQGAQSGGEQEAPAPPAPPAPEASRAQ